MNPDQYSCNIRHLILLHTMNYQEFDFAYGTLQLQYNSDIYRFIMYINHEWEIDISLLKKVAIEFVRHGYKTLGYYAYISFKRLNWKVIFK